MAAVVGAVVGGRLVGTAVGTGGISVGVGGTGVGGTGVGGIGVAVGGTTFRGGSGRPLPVCGVQDGSSVIYPSVGMVGVVVSTARVKIGTGVTLARG